MAPEQVRGKTVDARADIRVWRGAVRMVSGSRAFHRETAADTMSAILNQEPPDQLGRGRSFACARPDHSTLPEESNERFRRRATSRSRLRRCPDRPRHIRQASVTSPQLSRHRRAIVDSVAAPCGHVAGGAFLGRAFFRQGAGVVAVHDEDVQPQSIFNARFMPDRDDRLQRCADEQPAVLV
jgi:hypothetical protein